MNEQEKQQKDNDIKNQGTGDMSAAKENLKQTADKAASAVSDVVSGNTGAATQKAKDVYADAKETTKEVAGQAVEKAKEQAAVRIDEQRSNLAQGLNTVAKEIRTLGKNLGKSKQESTVVNFTSEYGDALADRVERISHYVEDKSLSELVTDVESFAKRNPSLFIAGAFVAGFVGGRFLKSSNPASGKSSRRTGKATASTAGTDAKDKPGVYPV